MRQDVKSSKENNSILTTPVSKVQKQTTYKPLNRKILLRAQVSESTQTYLIHISGTKLDGNTVEVSKIYDELHPLMAVGRAVVEFSNQYAGCRIDYLTYQQKVIK